MQKFKITSSKISEVTYNGIKASECRVFFKPSIRCEEFLTVMDIIQRSHPQVLNIKTDKSVNNKLYYYAEVILTIEGHHELINHHMIQLLDLQVFKHGERELLYKDSLVRIRSHRFRTSEEVERKIHHSFHMTERVPIKHINQALGMLDEEPRSKFDDPESQYTLGEYCLFLTTQAGDTYDPSDYVYMILPILNTLMREEKARRKRMKKENSYCYKLKKVLENMFSSGHDYELIKNKGV